MAQGIAWDKEKVVQALEPYFKLGCTRRKACKYAGFDHSVLVRWEQKHPELTPKIDAWISEPNEAARRAWIGKIKEGDYTAAKDWLDRIEKDDFSTKTINETTLTANAGAIESLRQHNASFEEEPEAPLEQSLEDEQPLPDKK